MVRFVFRWAWRWAMFAIALLGIGRILRALMPDSGDESSRDFARTAVMEGAEYASRCDDLRRGEIRVVMGGLRVDLRDASPAPEGLELDVFVKAGGVEILVPSHWQVDVGAEAMMGGRIGAPAPVDGPSAPAPQLTVRGMVLLGGLQIDRA